MEANTPAVQFMHLSRLASEVPDLLVTNCSKCGELLAAKLQSPELLDASGLRVVATRVNDKPLCTDCLNAMGVK